MTHTPATLPGGEDAATIRAALKPLLTCEVYLTRFERQSRERVKLALAALDRLLAAAPEPPLNRSAATSGETAGHTPLPWVIERHDEEDGSISWEVWNHSPEYYTRILKLNDECTGDEVGDPQARANAALIVAAVNRSPLVEEMAKALEVARDRFADLADIIESGQVYTNFEFFRASAARCDEALAKFRAGESAP